MTMCFPTCTAPYFLPTELFEATEGIVGWVGGHNPAIVLPTGCWLYGSGTGCICVLALLNVIFCKGAVTGVLGLTTSVFGVLHLL